VLVVLWLMGAAIMGASVVALFYFFWEALRMAAGVCGVHPKRHTTAEVNFSRTWL
jgi:hypothetical protein